jgi:SAM-dependent methyltransferase
MHEERARAGSFGAEAERYDRARPRYPDALVDDLVALAGGAPRVLDVGCGTGIAGAAFAARGCDVLGVEPDERMSEVARRKGLDVEVATFEEWDARGRSFDLVVSGQAWHWVDPERGPAKAASLLRDGGVLAPFWNLGRHDPATQAALDEVYGRHAPTFARGSVALGRVRRDGDAEAIRACGLFEEPEERRYEWTERYTAAEWTDQLRTHSDHALLDAPVREALLAEVAGVVEALGGTMTMAYDTVAVVARRR